jgi:dihydrofolate reductase
MSRIVYYVATSLDGYIAGPNGDISRFVAAGDGVDRYLQDLQQFRTVIMGKNTYEFGYRYGLESGQPAYPHMQHYIFSSSLELPHAHDAVHVLPLTEEAVLRIRDESPTDVYLCGGGELAGWLLDRGLIDVLQMKLSPIVLGGGIRLFGPSTTAVTWQLRETRPYDGGLQIFTYERMPQ